MALTPEFAQIASVSPKIPQLWTSNIRVWIAQVDIQFSLAKISNSHTKFSHVVATLSEDVCHDLQDIILDPPTDDPYARLCEALVSRHARTTREDIQQLLTSETLGDRKPSQMLRSMLSLLGTRNYPNNVSIVRDLFMQRLPSNVQQILAISADQDLTSLASLADKIMEVHPTPVCATLPHESSSLHSKLVQLEQQVHALTLQLASQQNAFRHRSKSPHRQPSSRAKSPNRPHSDKKCYYHRRFGSKALKCTSPCSLGNANGSN